MTGRVWVDCFSEVLGFTSGGCGAGDGVVFGGAGAKRVWRAANCGGDVVEFEGRDGAACLPVLDGADGHMHPLCQVFLCDPRFAPGAAQALTECARLGDGVGVRVLAHKPWSRLDNEAVFVLFSSEGKPTLSTRSLEGEWAGWWWIPSKGSSGDSRLDVVGVDHGVGRSRAGGGMAVAGQPGVLDGALSGL